MCRNFAPQYLHFVSGLWQSTDLLFIVQSRGVLHRLNRPYAGHYVSYIQVQGKWFYFDDAQVEMASQSDIEGTFGQASEWTFGNDSHAYLLFYQLVERESQDIPGSNPSDTPESSDGPATVADAGKQHDDALHKGATGPDRV